jgi:hypothetical protein
MSLNSSLLALVLLFGSSCVQASNGLPDKGVLPNEESAIKVAETILVNVYGEKVLEERPFKAKLDGETWIITGTFHCPQGSVCKGGVAHIEISKKDGKVRSVIHDK